MRNKEGLKGPQVHVTLGEENNNNNNCVNERDKDRDQRPRCIVCRLSL